MLFPWQVAVTMAAGVVMLVLACIAQTQKRLPVANPFSAACLFAGIMCFLYGSQLGLTSLPEKILLVQLALSVALFLPLFSFEVAYRFVYERPFFRGWILVAGLVVPVLTVILVWTINHSPIFRYDCWLDTSGGIPLLRYTSGPWEIVIYAYVYSLALWSSVILLASLRSATPWVRRARILFFFARLIPIIFDILYHFKIPPPAGMNYGPASLAVTDILTAIVFFGDRIGYRAYLARSTLVERISDLLIVLDEHHRVLDLNRAAVEMFGVRLESIQGRPAEALFGSWKEVLAQLRMGPAEAVEVERDGEFFDLAVMPAAGQARAGIVLLWLRNITRRKKAEQGYVAAAALAKEANEAKDRYLAVVSHEIRSPLNSVLGFLRLLEETPLDQEQKEYIGHLSQSGDSLFSVINEVLDFSKIEAGHMQLVVAPFDLRAEVLSLCRTLKIEAEAKGLVFDCSIAEDVPAVVVGDKLRIGQILRNLISNAVKFTAKGGIEVRVDRPEQAGAGPECVLRFAVTDTGIGIAPAEMEALFRPFSQATSSIQHEYGGTGLGLVIAQRFSELMGGKITVESVAKRGSTFTCLLRLGLGPNSPLPEAESPSQHLTPSLRILVVDDQPVNRRLVQIMLARMKHKTDAAVDGFECLAFLQAKEFDVVILDIEMPGIDGFEVARKIRAQGQKPSIIALTAHASTNIRERCFEAGMNAYLSKPITAVALKEALNKVAVIR